MQEIDLILGKLQGELTAEEEKAFQEWFLASHEHEELFNHFKSLQNQQAVYDRFRAIDVEHAWREVKKKVANERVSSTRVVRIRPFWSIAASVAVLLVAGFLVLSYFNNKEAETELSWEAFGHPGTSKAFLTTTGSEEFILGDQRDNSQLEANIPSDNNGKLRYDLLNAATPMSEKEHKLRTPKGGEYQIILSDGTKVWMNANSSLRYPPMFEGSQRIVYLEGEAFFEVARDENRPFTVKTKKMDVAVLGTAFNVKAYEEEVFATTLVEGKVAITDRQGRITPLDPGLQYTILPESEGFQVSQVNAQEIAAWKDGEFYFEKMELEQILKRVSNWYNFEYQFADDKSKYIKFTGTVYRQKSLKLFLDALMFSHPIEANLEDGKLIIRSK